MTNFTFADRYSEAGLEPRAEKILLREKSVKQIVETINKKQILDLARFYYGCSDIDMTWFRDVFAEADAGFSMVNNDREARVLSAMVLSALINENESKAILAVSLGSLRGLRAPPQSEWLVYEAEEAFLACAVEERADESVLSKISPTGVQKLTDELAAAEEAPDIATLVSLVSQVRDEARSSAMTTSKQVSAALDVCSRQLSLMREETQMLWWLTNGHSSLLSRSFNTFTPAQAALLGAMDLGKLTTFTLLGPVAIPAMLDKIVLLAKKTRGEPVTSLDALIDSFKTEDREKFDIFDGLPPELAPITTAIALANATGSGLWHERFKQKTGMEATLSLSAVTMAEQLYREHLLGQLIDG
ncbi:GTPase-associated system all-helical protein GASH [Pantoea sp. GbtcB22]|uniref:GTPase-associated system all-helical protein GASH n=1 Tax=Pantoea sp. GbtcB22 TaxID=2824767 RepID=UPI001C300EB2|nr:GTPase-associated system all-helical protein GASH [Pantoea sp. GbtcB22]